MVAVAIEVLVPGLPEPVLEPADVLDHGELLWDEGGRRGDDGRPVPTRVGGVLLGRPLVHRLAPEDLPSQLRQHHKSSGAQYLGVVLVVQFDPPAPGRAYTAVDLTVTLDGPEARAVSLEGRGGLQELLEDRDAPAGRTPAGLRWLRSSRPRVWSLLSRSARGRDALDDPQAHRVRSSGLLMDKFTWSVEADGGLPQDALATYSVVEVPDGADHLRGTITCQVTMQLTEGRFVREIPTRLDRTLGFSERFAAPDDGSAPRGADAGANAVRLFVSADVAGYGQYRSHEAEQAQRSLNTVMESARSATGHEVEDRQEGGDSLMYVFPPGVDEGELVRRFYGALLPALRAANLDPSRNVAIRLRLAIFRGQARRADTGWVGQAPVAVARLRDSSPSREALERARGADFVLTIAEEIYEDLILDQTGPPAPASFVPVDIEVKEFAKRVWLHVPPQPVQG